MIRIPARRIVPCALVALAAAAVPLAPAAAAAEGPALDVVIAIDTTGSMTPSIEQAKRDARQVVADTQAAIPGSRFAVIQFRDSTDATEYQLVQAMTADPDAVAAAIRRLLTDDVFHASCVHSLERIRPRFAWNVVARPLVEAVKTWLKQP